MPSYSCQFNSVEFVWALFKRKFPEIVAQNVQTVTNKERIEEVVLNMIA